MFNIVERYINKMTKEDVYNFGVKKNVNLSDDELTFTYNFIKKNYKQILSNPNILNLDRYKNIYSEDNFIKIKELFKEYYTKYHKFL